MERDRSHIVPYLLRQEAEARAERERQSWAHALVIRKCECIVGNGVCEPCEARQVHDWHACPDCDRIGCERSGGLMAGNPVRPMVRRKVDAKAKANAEARYDRKVAKRRDDRRDRRRNKSGA